MMSANLIPDPEKREAWRRQFSAIRSIGLVDVAEVAGGAEGACVTCKVKLDVRLDPAAVSRSRITAGMTISMSGGSCSVRAAKKCG
jgi:hypothetical protein